MCLTAPRVSQAGNKLDIPVGSHSTPKESPGVRPELTFNPKESLGPCPEFTFEDLGPLPFPDIHNYQILSSPPLDTTQQQDFPIVEGL